MNQKKLDLARKNLEVTASLADVHKKEKLEDNFDPEIFDIVITLNALGFKTYSSCQGHVEKIDLTAHVVVSDLKKLGDEEYYKTLSKQEILNLYYTNSKTQKRLKDLLDEFYINRITPMRYRISINNNGLSGAILEANIRWMQVVIEDENERIKFNKEVLKEVHAFNDFLITKLN